MIFYMVVSGDYVSRPVRILDDSGIASLLFGVEGCRAQIPLQARATYSDFLRPLMVASMSALPSETELRVIGC